MPYSLPCLLPGQTDWAAPEQLLVAPRVPWLGVFPEPPTPAARGPAKGGRVFLLQEGRGLSSGPGVRPPVALMVVRHTAKKRVIYAEKIELGSGLVL